MFWIDEAQDGVVSRRQLHAAGLGDKAIERLLRRREVAVVHPGVYLNHTGEPSWRQRAWAALLLCDPVLGIGATGQSRRSDLPRATRQLPGRAALAGPSALRISLEQRGFLGPNLRVVLSDDRIHLAIERDRRIRAPEMVVLHRTSHLLARARWAY
ncbi:type IV toxin-antitoxin system AbiEi family antitoxin domain-containing protein [Nocardioides sp. Bht2]|uniref:type IV toxin-antitoxin system AbiEi family antitoxin domain-containing protein n=1 Tax=Nocardioides sp. Bht2 TaxID=3392297 RepID=UPI0039B5009C